MITVLTGSSAGIGAAAALDLANRGHQLVLVGRSSERLAEVAGAVERASGALPETFSADFTSFDDVRRLAEQVRERHERIDVLINNAGMMTLKRQTTGDGHEAMMQVNHLSPFLLTNLLLDRVGRVVTTSSRAGRTGALDPDDLSQERRRWSGGLQEGDTKQANALFTVALAERGVAATCIHPGVLRTGFADETFFMTLVHRVPGMGEPVEAGGARLAALADQEGESGRFYHKDRIKQVPERMSDPALAARLWKASLTAVGL